MTNQEVIEIRNTVRDSCIEILNGSTSLHELRGHAEILAMFAEAILRNLPDKKLGLALADWRPETNKVASKFGTIAAAEVFMAARQKHQLDTIGPTNPYVERKAALELAYWAFYNASELRINQKKGEWVAVDGPSKQDIDRTIDDWRNGKRTPIPRSDGRVDAVKMRDTVVPALREAGFLVEFVEAEQFKQSVVRKRTSGKGSDYMM